MYIQSNIEFLQYLLRYADIKLQEAVKRVKFYRESYGIEPPQFTKNVNELKEKCEVILGNIDLWKGFKKSYPNYRGRK